MNVLPAAVAALDEEHHVRDSSNTSIKTGGGSSTTTTAAGNTTASSTSSGSSSPFVFDTCPDRRHSGCVQWDFNQGKYHFLDKTDVLPRWVADMDFVAAPAIQQALMQRTQHGVYGYTIASTANVRALREFLLRRHQWQVEDEWIVFVPGLVSALNVFLRAFGGKAGDNTLTMIPVYPPFIEAPPIHDLELHRIPWKETAEGWRVEMDVFRQQTDARTRSFLLCSPHNPTGRVYTREELSAIAEHCRKHNLYVCSDEIWADLVLEGKHIPFAVAAPELALRSVTLVAPSKAFNLPGLSCGAAIIPSAEMREAFTKASMGLVPFVNLYGLTAAEAAWSLCDEWLDAACVYLKDNRDVLTQALQKMPCIRYYTPQATYLAWLDVRRAKVDDPFQHALACGLGLFDGVDFGAPGFLRFNFACPRSLLLRAIECLQKAFGGPLPQQ